MSKLLLQLFSEGGKLAYQTDEEIVAQKISEAAQAPWNQYQYPYVPINNPPYVPINIPPATYIYTYVTTNKPNTNSKPIFEVPVTTTF